MLQSPSWFSIRTPAALGSPLASKNEDGSMAKKPTQTGFDKQRNHWDIHEQVQPWKPAAKWILSVCLMSRAGSSYLEIVASCAASSTGVLRVKALTSNPKTGAQCLSDKP